MKSKQIRNLIPQALYRYTPGYRYGPGRDKIIVRGGAWNNIDKKFFRCTFRYRYSPDYRYGSIGFRVVSPPSFVINKEAEPS